MNLRKAINKRLNKKGIEEIQEKLEKASELKKGAAGERGVPDGSGPEGKGPTGRRKPPQKPERKNFKSDKEFYTALKRWQYSQKSKKQLEKATKERLEKAKYIKRTGSPGKYKYQYREGKKIGIGKDFSEQDKRYGPKDKVDLKTHGENFKKMTSEMVDMLKRGVNPHTTKGRAEIKRINAKYENKVNTYPVGEYAGMWKNKETWLKEIVPGKAKSKEGEKKEEGKEDYSDWDHSELVGEFQENIGEQDLINYVAKKTKIPSSEIEWEDVVEYTEKMSKKQLLKELE